MREAVGGTWLFGIVISFIVLFSSYLAVSVNYSKAFQVKNKIVQNIEHNIGLNSDAQAQNDTYMKSVGHAVYSKCKAGSHGFIPEPNNMGYLYCIDKITDDGAQHGLKTTRYNVTVYFRLDLPIVGGIFTFPVTGETKNLIYAEDSIR